MRKVINYVESKKGILCRVKALRIYASRNLPFTAFRKFQDKACFDCFAACGVLHSAGIHGCSNPRLEVGDANHDPG